MFFVFLRILITGTALTLALSAIAQKPVIDAPRLENRKEDQKSVETGKTKTTHVNCNISGKERSRRMRRSIDAALQEESHNAGLVRHYGKAHDVPESLALAVAYHESRMDTCAGSPTGVKGVMQLTIKTGRGFGLDRNINEQNINGGVQTLKSALKSCGNKINYRCLARYYNGSPTPGEQEQWAFGVARAHKTMDHKLGTNTAPDVQEPVMNTSVVYGYGQSGTIRQRTTRTTDSINKAGRFINRSDTERQRLFTIFDLASDAAGYTERFHDAVEDNAWLRDLSAEAFNLAIEGRNMSLELETEERLDDLAKKSSLTDFIKFDEATANPFK